LEHKENVSVDENLRIIEALNKKAFLLIEAALDEFDVDVHGLTAIDIGASTGGFTDVLLQRGAVKVYAVENGTAQLHEKLLSDSRVVSLENTDARNLTDDLVPLCDIAVMDVSFISQTLLHKAVSQRLRVGGVFISLIKPQFEAGRTSLNKKGIVKDEKVRRTVVDKVIESAKLFGFEFVGCCQSAITGGDGNIEYLAMFRKEKLCENDNGCCQCK
jgi:23S rRNA (cytidine1920-2'-O)/16S rRNA (cytidine1409-2'-O)-methyltransferase